MKRDLRKEVCKESGCGGSCRGQCCAWRAPKQAWMDQGSGVTTFL